MTTTSQFIAQAKVLSQDIFASIFEEEPTARQLVMLAVSLAIFWALTFHVLTQVILLFVRHEPAWLVAAATRDYAHGGKEMAESFGLDPSEEACRKLFIMMWPYLQLVYLQHAIGGLLCVPSVFSLLPENESLANSLACLGILSEMGWEIQDLISWICTRYLTANGKQKVAIPLLIIFAVHHSLTTILAVPLILNYRNLKTLHWICFELQFASFVCLGVKEYSKLLDLREPGQLQQFQHLTLLALMVGLWSRVIHWMYLLGEFMMVWYNDKAYGFLAVGGALGTLFSLFSYVCIVEPSYKRWVKFRARKAEYEQVLTDQSSNTEQRRSSFVALDAAAGDLLRELEEEADLLELAERLFPSKMSGDINRRSSLPASLWLGSQRRGSFVLNFLQDPSSSMDSSARRATFHDSSLSTLITESELMAKKET